MTKLKELILYSLKLTSDNFEDLYSELGDNLCIYGSAGLLDSMDLVMFIAGLELAIQKELNKEISIVSDKTFSLRTSPFRSITAFEEYLKGLLE